MQMDDMERMMMQQARGGAGGRTEQATPDKYASRSLVHRDRCVKFPISIAARSFTSHHWPF